MLAAAFIIEAAFILSPAPLARRVPACTIGHATIFPAPTFAHSADSNRGGLPVAAADADPYSVLGVSRDATAAQIKQAYRKLALRSHPDVNKAPDAEETFTRIAEAYATLSDPKERSKYDRSGASRWRSAGSAAGASSRGASSGSTWGGFDPTDPVGWATGATSRDPAAAAAAAERARRWREENPTPDELGDSFGSLFSDVVSAVGNAVAGSGDWLSLLDELSLSEGPELQALLRSRDASALADELENTQWVQKTLASRIERLTSEVKAAEEEMAAFRSEGSAGSMAKSFERELQRDIRKRTERVTDARRLLTQAKSREQRISARIEELKNGGGGRGGGGESVNRGRSLPSVDDELESLRRKVGKPAGDATRDASKPPPSTAPPRSTASTAPRAPVEGMKAAALKAELTELGVDTTGLFEKSDYVEAVTKARARAGIKTRINP